MRTSTGRRNLVVALVCIFGMQTALVYVDDTGRKTPRLSERAQIGWRVWHDHNCQSCHQLFGFGGFLGPDLTNAIEYLAPERLETILTTGGGPMPAFGLSRREIDGFTAYLEELNATGRGQLRLVTTPPPADLLEGIVATLAESHPLDAAGEIGRRFVRERKCISCHLPFEQSTIRAPDMRAMVDRLGPAGVVATIEAGRLANGMPPFALADDEKPGVVAFLTWMRDRSEPLGIAFQSAAKSRQDGRIPWFEYPR